MKYVLATLLLFSCGQEPSKKSEPAPNLPPQESPKPQPEPPKSPWPIPDFPGGGWPFPIPDFPGGENPMPNPIPLPPEGGGTSVVDKETYLRFHNLKRCWHQVGNVLWDESLAARAKAHAERCVFAHDATANAGENLAIGYPDDIKAMDAWYMEFLKYDFSRGTFSPQTGHFTQMVWKGTTQIGCGTAQCPQGRFLVCRYLPQGNVLGQFQQNVLPLRSDVSQC